VRNSGNMAFVFEKLEIPDVFVVRPQIYGDDRGTFAELFKASEFEEYTEDLNFKQVNYSQSQGGVLRGLHYQLSPKAQGKLVSAMSGSVFDVVVDLRRDSPTFKQWVSVTLDAAEKTLIFVPKGFAHGFYVTSDQAEVVYYCTDEYAPDMERGIIWNDRAINIQWPSDSPTVSAKDADYPNLSEAEYNF